MPFSREQAVAVVNSELDVEELVKMSKSQRTQFLNDYLLELKTEILNAPPRSEEVSDEIRGQVTCLKHLLEIDEESWPLVTLVLKAFTE